MWKSPESPTTTRTNVDRVNEDGTAATSNTVVTHTENADHGQERRHHRTTRRCHRDAEANFILVECAAPRRLTARQRLAIGRLVGHGLRLDRRGGYNPLMRCVIATLIIMSVASSARAERAILLEARGGAIVPLGDGQVDQFNSVEAGVTFGVEAGIQLRPRISVHLLTQYSQLGTTSGNNGPYSIAAIAPGVRLHHPIARQVELLAEANAGVVLAGRSESRNVGLMLRGTGSVIWWLGDRIGLGLEFGAQVSSFHDGSLDLLFPAATACAIVSARL